jgi:molecular chaperone GrpE
MSGKPDIEDPNHIPEQATDSVADAAAAFEAAPDAASAESRITELEGQIADLTDRLLRSHAEIDNIRKRGEREKSDMAKYAISKFAGDVVTLSDNFGRAVSALPAGAADHDPALKSLLEGVQMMEREFLNVLERHGVKRIDPTGEPFNPHLHQAVMEQPNTGVPTGTVLQVFQAGYTIEDRVLRPAMVVVSRGGPKPQDAQAAAEGSAAAKSASAGDGSETPGSDS